MADGTTFDFGLGYKDFTKIAWTFVQGVLGYAVLVASGVLNGQTFSGKALLVGAAAAGVSAIKNFLLSDTSPVK